MGGTSVRITVTVEEPADNFQERLLALLAEYAGQVEVDSEWTAERATRYYRELPAGAAEIIRTAAINGGFVSDEELREGKEDAGLRGVSGPLKRTLDRGIREGWLPAGIKPPVVAHGPGFGKVKGYEIAEGLVETIFGAIADVTQHSVLEQAIRTQDGEWTPDRGIAVLIEAGYEPTEKHVRRVYRTLATKGLLEKTDPNSATYRRTRREN